MARENLVRILIVDDDPKVIALLSQHLAGEGLECVTACGAFDALNKFKRDRFTLILSDINMPGMSGIDLLRLVRRNDPEVPIIMITGVLEVDTAVHCLRLGASDYITKPFNLPSVTRSIHQAIEKRQLLDETRCYQKELENKILDRTMELNEALREVEESYRMTLDALVSALDAREHETQAHSQRVREYTLALARRIGIDGDELVHIGRGALLHDVGKIGVQDSILLKPERLTAREWIEMKKHPQIGFEIVRSIQFLSPAAEIVLTHQERWDGKGYPNGLAGTEIPLGARIFSVADTLDAMTSHRCYRRALLPETAFADILRGSGTQFDPLVVEAFRSIPPETWMEIQERVNSQYGALEYSTVP